MRAFILGPSRWRRGRRPAVPSWVAGFLPTLWQRRGRAGLWPLDVRAAMAEALRRTGSFATLMEAHELRGGESHTGLFHRIARSEAIDRFLVYWPAGAQRSGVDIELGFLLQWLDEGRDPDIRVLVESGAGRVVDGYFESVERGYRSRYYEDVVAYGCPIVPWEDYGELWDALRHHAR